MEESSHTTPLKSEYYDVVFHFSPDEAPLEFWVITAWNPDGQDQSEAENKSADEELRRVLLDRNLNFFRITGSSPDESHAEPGWGVVTDESTALNLSRRFRQEAVFHFHSSGIDLVNCANGERSALSEPGSRIPTRGIFTGKCSSTISRLKSLG